MRERQLPFTLFFVLRSSFFFLCLFLTKSNHHLRPAPVPDHILTVGDRCSRPTRRCRIRNGKIPAICGGDFRYTQEPDG